MELEPLGFDVGVGVEEKIARIPLPKVLELFGIVPAMFGRFEVFRVVFAEGDGALAGIDAPFEFLLLGVCYFVN